MIGSMHDAISPQVTRTGARLDCTRLWPEIAQWATELGFSAAGVAALDMDAPSRHLERWLALGRQGEMDYMARHAALRAQPSQLLPSAQCAISVRHDYWPAAADPWATLADGKRAYVSRYALGRDYHKTLRRKLQTLATRLGERIGPYGYRVCVDSAPVFESELAARSGVGWRGKHTLTLTRTGSWHFLGEILTDLPLPPTAAIEDHCGSCTRCLDLCPTGAIVAPYEVDARRCISYLTIEHRDSIPLELRAAMGNRIYGCDDCQLVCPWNRFARRSGDPDFAVRNHLDAAALVELFAWSEHDFNERLAGSPIRRIGWERWLRNIAVALGNALRAKPSVELHDALGSRIDHPSAVVREHARWAMAADDDHH
ncbi:MAG TPA: tRNA epoxyqueuosine(34) reductase QueG [Rhodocyclaceae bacterium]